MVVNFMDVLVVVQQSHFSLKFQVELQSFDDLVASRRRIVGEGLQLHQHRLGSRKPLL